MTLLLGFVLLYVGSSPGTTANLESCRREISFGRWILRFSVSKYCTLWTNSFTMLRQLVSVTSLTIQRDNNRRRCAALCSAGLG